MSSAPAVHVNPSRPAVSPERERSERANRRATLALFAGLFILGAVGITVGIVANSLINHGHRAPISTASASVPAATPEAVSLYVAPSWKLGPDGQRHDAFSKTSFNVKVGQPMKLTIDNRDTAIHSITASEAGVNVVVAPGTHTYTFVVNHAGRFKWVCVYSCDPFSMSTVGYMQGYITAT